MSKEKKVGAPIQYTPERIEEIRLAIEKYIEETEIPIVAEFAYKYNIRRTTLYDIPELANTIKKLIDKKEAKLERGMLTNQLNATASIFSLKQMGWSDKLDTVNKHEIQGDMLQRVAELFIKD